MLRTYISILIAAMGLILSADAPAGYLEHYTEEDGLGDNMISQIYIGESGVKWFASFAYGVSRFDELSWRSYPRPTVGDMTEDHTGRLWISGPSPGIWYLEEDMFHALSYPTFTYCTAVTFGPDGALWTGGWVGQLQVWRSFHPFYSSQWKCWKGLIPWKFAIDADGRVWSVGPVSWIGAYTSGVCRISVDGETWDRIDDNLRLPADGIEYRGGIYASPGGRVWVQGVTDDYTRLLPPYYSDDYETWFTFDESPFKPSRNDALWIECLSQEGLWFSSSDPTYLNGGFWYDGHDWRFIAVGAPVRAIEVDEPTADVWFGTTNGVYVMRGGPEAWPPVWIELDTVANPSGDTPTLSVLGSAEFQMDLQLDLYVAVELPDGTLLFAPNWSASMAPLVPNLEAPIGLSIEKLPLATLDTDGIPTGTYRWHAACTHAGSMDFASNIASCDWRFAK